MVIETSFERFSISMVNFPLLGLGYILKPLGLFKLAMPTDTFLQVLDVQPEISVTIKQILF